MVNVFKNCALQRMVQFIQDGDGAVNVIHFHNELDPARQGIRTVLDHKSVRTLLVAGNQLILEVRK
jgi:hypothetical protein